ncbi:hypothetical protein CONCODRAFT_12379 [Conidiobolus coronatus NRRL 28638]|uniref:Uncharacterized protein n=1 Tax=Conidiobolus coronatus (strain ATCC 28846 / CBS 209.66 / NRRL 28638) TaxID=796925 RepID=A0A137NTB2_CONC2|nr:hypothetical protein CONCODRAFT_12379 [Conidiobolus coronatus NRRL 28638]|eukprot:KXN65918.1 hypothetical protein CONCODRAFT_12379 [Conidiobolus coronatus NRRL 28638]
MIKSTSNTHQLSKAVSTNDHSTPDSSNNSVNNQILLNPSNFTNSAHSQCSNNKLFEENV